MKRNRKNQAAAVRFGPALKAALLVLLFGGSALGYVWQKNQIHGLGRQIKDLEVRLDRLRYENQKLGQQVVLLRSPLFLERRVRELNLGLAMPSPSQVMRLVEGLPENPPGPPGLPGAEQPLRHVTLK